MIRRAEIEKWLKEHVPTDDLEAEHLQRMQALVRGSDAPFSRHTMHPGHFTASAFVVSPDDQKLLMILHAKLGLWLQPGGHIDPEDVSLIQAARREVAEETGIVALDLLDTEAPILDVDIHRIPASPKRGELAHAHFDIRIGFRARAFDFSAGSDALDARWVGWEEMSTVETDESVARAVRKLRSLLTP